MYKFPGSFYKVVCHVAPVENHLFRATVLKLFILHTKCAYKPGMFHLRQKLNYLKFRIFMFISNNNAVEYAHYCLRTSGLEN